MKRYFLTVAVVSLAGWAIGQQLGDSVGPAGQGQPPPPPLVQTKPTDGDAAYYYDSLQPHGPWMQVEPFGVVWQPHAAVKETSWRPYHSGGKWAWSNNAWCWNSEYEWGWAPFHYGRWVTSKYLGWVWIPGRVWSPGWVAWNQTSTQVGWAPMPPEVSTGIGIYGSSGNGFSWGFQLSLTPDHYVYAPCGDFGGVTVVRDTGRDNHYYSGNYDRDRYGGSYRHQMDRPVVQSVGIPIASRSYERSYEPSRRTTGIREAVTRTAPSSGGSRSQQGGAPSVNSSPRPSGGNSQGGNTSGRRTHQIQDIISRSRK
jgi:hypothetical protein